MVKQLSQYILLLLLQVWIANKIALFGYATPIVYIYPLLHISTLTSRNTRLLTGFCYGLLIDMFANTPGMNAAAATALMFVQPYINRLFLHRNVEENVRPSIHNLRYGGYLFYVLTCSLLMCTTLMLLSSFFGVALVPLLTRTLSSALLTTILIYITSVLLKDGQKR